MIAAIRDALKVAFDTIDDLRVHDTVPPDLVPPAAVIAPATIGPHDTQSGSRVCSFAVILVVSRASERAGQDQLDALLDWSDTESVFAAVEDNPTLTDLVADVNLRMNDYGEVTVGDISYWGARLTADVMI